MAAPYAENRALRNMLAGQVAMNIKGQMSKRDRLERYGPDERSVAFGAMMGNVAAQGQLLRRREDGYTGKGAYRKGKPRYARSKLRTYGQRIKRAKYRGKGDYDGNSFSIFGNASAGGGGGGMSSFMGRGNYGQGGGGGVVNNAIVNGGSGTGIPTFAPQQAEYRISKAEFVQSIYAPATAGAFQNTVLALQPGLQESFPWLGLVAPQFEEYEFEQMIWYWRPMVSDFNSGTGQVGEIIMVTQYNPSDEPFTDVLRAKSYQNAMSCKTSACMNQGVECDPSLNSGAAGKYVRTGPLSQGSTAGGSTDIKQYDLGNLNVIVTGTPTAYSGQLLGELWCTYTVLLRKPKLPQTTGSTILRDTFASRYSVDEVGTVKRASYAPTIALNDLRDTEIAYGAQNRINPVGTGLILESGIVGTNQSQARFTYNVPTWYTGTLSLTLTIQGSSNIKGVTDMLSGVTNKVNPFPAGTPLFGGIASISPPQWTWTVTNFSSAQPVGTPLGGVFEYYNVTLVAHVQVAARTDGGSSFVELTCVMSAPQDNVAPIIQPGVAGWTLDVTEYNDAFNNRNDEIAFVDDNGEPIETGATTAP